ncbi:TonB-linked outer membrane protein, SusC/RagA family [Chitinophaga rupis]|uniref:TonB-linked outer membrane protein, SusC/RagA family n=2 Tax=Chitinophaga rupis TaxID=573321 RepID=A0A1H7VXN6_9BACT|nr:TonB-linked outer membrane protein, SusC/RagA family [Chitinophaga rupis]
MQKNCLSRTRRDDWIVMSITASRTKIGRIMRLTALLLTVALLQVQASTSAQTVTLTGKDLTLKEIFSVIKEQTGYLVFGKQELLESGKPVTIVARNMALTEFLDKVMKDQPLTYKITGKSIALSAKPAAAFKPVAPSLSAEDTTITGKVVAEDGTPIPGATVKLKNSNIGVTTDAEGNFILPKQDGNEMLLISFVGYQTREVPFRGKSILAVMNIDVQKLDEVAIVTTGYQKIPKERATGSFGTVSRAQLNKPSINISQRLIGAVAGVQARSMDADGTPSFEIRGQTSLYGNARPLVVVDGFAIQGDFSSINPNDVESITVLKDAAAASIWGARAANGVIVITTKSAEKSTPLKVEFSAFTRVGKKMDLDYVRPLASSAETVDYEMKAFNNWSALPNSGALNSNVNKVWSPATVAMSEQFLGYITLAQRDSILNRLRTQDNRQQIKDNLLANPINQQYNLTLYGSSSKMSNALSLLFEKNQSNFKETGYERYMLNYRTMAVITKWLDVDLSAMVQHTRSRYDGVTLADINSFSPYEMLVNPNGSYTNISQYYTPILQRFVPMDKFPYSDWSYNPIQEIHSRDSSVSQLNARLQAGLTFKLVKGLTINSRIQYETFNSNNRYLRDENSFYVRKTVNEATTWNQGTNTLIPNLPKGSILNQSRNKVESWNFRNQLNYNRAFGSKHEINLAAGFEVNSTVAELYGYPTTYGYNDETLTIGTFPNGPGGIFSPITNWLGNNQTFSYTGSFNYTTERYYSSYANLAYTYGGRYTISGSYRTDASNLITDDPKYRYAPFWSIGGLWNLTSEKFLNGTTWLDHLRLRATYGYNGNVDKFTAFMPLIATVATPNTWTNDYTATISSYGNPTLRWEKTGTWNLGVDYSLFNGRLSGKVDVYHKAGRDLIAQLSIPAVNGTTSQKLNNAKMTNKGIELELATVLPIRNDDIVWRGNLNFSYNRNRITDLFLANYSSPDLLNGGYGAYVVGMDANTLWRFEYSGVQNGQPTVLGPGKAPVTFTSGVPGDARTYLLNMGTTVAPYTLGFINSFKVYDFDFSFIITGKFGHVFQRKGFNYPSNRTRRVLPNSKLSEVVNGDPGKIIPLPLTPVEPLYYFWSSFHQYVSYLTESASHVRLQEVSLAYTIPQSLLRKMQLNSLQFYAQANDLYTWYKNDAKEDPEYPLGTLKPMPKLTLGLRLDF